MARTNGPIQVWHRTDTIPTDAEGGYAGGDSTAAAIALFQGTVDGIAQQVADITPASIGAAPEGHAANHATGGSDPITPADIGAALAGHEHSWAEVTGKPVNFPPSSHAHSWAQVTDKPTAFPPSSHTHPWTEVTDKPTAFPPSAHTHTPAEVGAYPASGSTYDGHIDSLVEPGAYRIGSGSMNAGNGYPWTPDGAGYVIVHCYNPSYVTQEVISQAGTTWRRNSAAGSWSGWTPIAVDTGWRVLPLENGWTGTLKVRWVNGQVYVTVQNLNGAAAANANLASNLGGSPAFYAGANNPALGVGNVSAPNSAPSGNAWGSIGMTGGPTNNILRASTPTSSWTNGAASLSFAASSMTLPTTLPGTPA